MSDQKPELSGAKPEGQRSCCDEEYCVRKYLDQLTEPESPITERIQTVAGEVARTCNNLRAEDLHLCAGRLFGLTPECDLTRLFVSAYGSECDSMKGKKPIGKGEASGNS